MEDIDYRLSVGVRPKANRVTLSADESNEFFNTAEFVEEYDDILRNLADTKEFSMALNHGPIDCRESLIGSLDSIAHYIYTAICGGNNVLIRVTCSGSMDKEFGKYLDSCNDEDKKAICNLLTKFMPDMESPHPVISVDKLSNGSIKGVSISFYPNLSTSWIRLSGLLMAIRLLPDMDWKVRGAVGGVLHYADMMNDDEDSDLYDLMDLGMDRTSIMALGFSLLVTDPIIHMLHNCNQNGPANLMEHDSISYDMWMEIWANTPKQYRHLLNEFSVNNGNLHLLLKNKGELDNGI